MTIRHNFADLSIPQWLRSNKKKKNKIDKKIGHKHFTFFTKNARFQGIKI